jgi:hypothetical protein
VFPLSPLLGFPLSGFPLFGVPLFGVPPFGVPPFDFPPFDFSAVRPFHRPAPAAARHPGGSLQPAALSFAPALTVIPRRMISRPQTAAGNCIVTHWRLLAATLTVCSAVLIASPAHAQDGATAADSAAIRAAALDYIEGWYEGDDARMRRALHPELTKRILMTPPDAPSRLSNMSANQLIAATANGGGRQTPAGERNIRVRILDVFGAAATVRVDAAEWIDYMHLSRTLEGWRIVNVLWELRPPGE